MRFHEKKHFTDADNSVYHFLTAVSFRFRVLKFYLRVI